jgi:hypothetical protein
VSSSLGERDPSSGSRDATRPLPRADDLEVEWVAPPPRPGPRRGSGAYWTGTVALVLGLGAVVVALATQVTSLAQTVLVAVPLALVGFGLERVGKSAARGSLRAVGVLLVLLALIAPMVLSLSSPRTAVNLNQSAAAPPGSTAALFRATLGGGQIQVGPGAAGLYEAQLRSPGTPTTGVSTNSGTAVVDLRAPAQHGLLARNRGSDWSAKLSTGLPWRVEVDGGALTTDLDLRGLDVRAIRVQSGLSRMAVRLGQPATQVPVDLQISAGLIDVYLPRAVSFEVRVDGFMLNNFADQGMRRGTDAWRTPETGGRGRFLVSVRSATGRVRVHRL